MLNHALGAHIFISANNLNASIDEFVALANRYLTQAKTAKINTP